MPLPPACARKPHLFLIVSVPTLNIMPRLLIREVPTKQVLTGRAARGGHDRKLSFGAPSTARRYWWGFYSRPICLRRQPRLHPLQRLSRTHWGWRRPFEHTGNPSSRPKKSRELTSTIIFSFTFPGCQIFNFQSQSSETWWQQHAVRDPRHQAQMGSRTPAGLGHVVPCPFCTT